MNGPDDKNLARLEALLTNWRLHLPLSKKDALMDNGLHDEMMFQAHMMMNATCIMLHQSYSPLNAIGAESMTSYAAYQTFDTHTKHTVAAACAISELITHRAPLLSHTHFFTGVVALSSIVHLKRWAMFVGPHDDDDLRQRIRLNIGALNHLSEVWTAADQARSQVQAVVWDINQLKKQQQKNPRYWCGYSQEDMLSSIAADEEMISEMWHLEKLQQSQQGLGGGM